MTMNLSRSIMNKTLNMHYAGLSLLLSGLQQSTSFFSKALMVSRGGVGTLRTIIRISLVKENKQLN